jgi:hypothetical protein
MVAGARARPAGAAAGRGALRAAALWAALLACALPGAAAAQGLRELSYAWAQGDFRAPLACVVDGASREALRRVRIHPAPRAALPALRITIYDLEAPLGTVCTGLASRSEPNVIGALELVFEGRSRPDTGQVDFRNALRRDGGFTFRIQQGKLRVGPAGEPESTLPSHDYTGGSARVGTVPPGSDGARRLATFGANRQLQLELAAPGAPALAFDLVELPR